MNEYKRPSERPDERLDEGAGLDSSAKPGAAAPSNRPETEAQDKDQSKAASFGHNLKDKAKATAHHFSERVQKEFDINEQISNAPGGESPADAVRESDDEADAVERSFEKSARADDDLS